MTLSEVANVLRSVDDGMTETTKSRLRDLLVCMPSCDAEHLYVDLCRIQIAADDDDTPMLSILHTDNPKHFVNRFLSTGVLIELVADSIELTENARKRKWQSEDMNLNLSARLHRETTQWHDNYSRFLFASREANRIAYDNVRAALFNSDIPRPHEWQTVILSEPTALCGRSILFWNAVQINRCTIDEKRAICHKLMLCKDLQDGRTVLRLHARIMDDIYMKTYDAHQRNNCARPRKAWYHRYLYVFTRRRHRRIAVTKPGGDGQCDSSAPAPVSPRFA